MGVSVADISMCAKFRNEMLVSTILKGSKFSFSNCYLRGYQHAECSTDALPVITRTEIL